MTAVELEPAPTGRNSGIDARGLVKSFRASGGIVHAVRGVDVSIATGETVALLGPNGAGKSTTIDMLLGLLEPDDGTVALFGRPPSEVVHAGSIGAMLQTGIDGFAGQRTQTLSGGQSQRVRFALALVSNPELLVLDEPTVGMDVEGRRAFWTTMRELAAKGKTVLFATHYLEEADAYADRAILIARGKIVASGPTTEIKAMVGTRTIRATLPSADLDQLSRLPGVTLAESRGQAVVLNCSDSDRAIRALLEQHPEARDIEISGAGLEQAFLQLTGDDGLEPR